MRKRYRLFALLFVSSWMVAPAFSAPESATTPTRSLTEDLGTILRQRLSEYQPLIDQMRKRAGVEAKKLQQWEYKVVAAETSDPVRLTELLNRWGEQGWECFHVVSAPPAAKGDLPQRHLFFFRKRKGSVLAQVPLRDVIRLLLYFSAQPTESQNSQ